MISPEPLAEIDYTDRAVIETAAKVLEGLGLTGLGRFHAALAARALFDAKMLTAPIDEWANHMGDAPADAEPKSWFREEYERAVARNAQIPPHARMVVTDPTRSIRPERRYMHD